jgi:hypothetical protein
MLNLRALVPTVNAIEGGKAPDPPQKDHVECGEANELDPEHGSSLIG